MYVVSWLFSEVLKTIVKYVETAKVELDLLRRVGADDFACSCQLSLLEQFKKLNSQGITAHVNERKSDSLESNTLEG